MIAELGHFALILALLMAAMRFITPLRRRAAILSFAFLLAALLALLWSYATFDFTVVSVAENTHTLKPPAGLLMAALLNADTLALLLCLAAALPAFRMQMAPRGLALLAAGLIALTLFIAHPFARIYPPPFEGIGYEAALDAALEDIP